MVTNLLADEQDIIRYADIRSYTNQAPTRLEVVASDDDPRITTALGEENYRRAIALLERHYNLILLDTGTGVLESATKGILQLADQIVVVMSPGQGRLDARLAERERPPRTRASRRRRGQRRARGGPGRGRQGRAALRRTLPGRGPAAMGPAPVRRRRDPDRPFAPR
jgi:hypothetical protein